MKRKTRGSAVRRGAAPPGALAYLRRPFRLRPLVALLFLGDAFAYAAHPRWSLLFVVLAVTGVCASLRVPRGLVHLGVLAALTIFISQFVFSLANGAQDSQSNRDEAVETAARRFVEGRNPWTDPSSLGTPITSGPASVLIATPAVVALGRVNELSFVFYLLFFAFLLRADATRRNETFVPLSLLLLSGLFGFQHTLYWSLEELYYAYAALALAWVLVAGRHLVAAGVCLGFALCARASYAFPLFGFVYWYARSERGDAKGLLRLAAGAALGTALLLAPFLWIGGREFLAHNPFATAGGFLGGSEAESNPLSQFLSSLPDFLGPTAGAVAKTTIALAVIWFAAERLRRASLDHPFWHVCIAAFVADFLVHRGAISSDYFLFFMVPGFLAASLSSGLAGPQEEDA